MALKKALIHRYDNEPDILAVEGNGCSEVYKRAKDDDFQLVIVVPTGQARTQTAVFADAVGGQYSSPQATSWPGRPDAYRVRVDVRNVRLTTKQKVIAALQKAHESWPGPWVIKTAYVEESELL